jgi:ABC-type Mn2+/Zn2+ transport system ATPase subunit
LIVNEDSQKQPLVELKNVGYWYPSGRPSEPVLKNLSLQVHKGQIVRITGRNGTGKTTLLKILQGELSPTVGEKKVFGSQLKVSYLDQDASAFSAHALTVQEQLVIGMADKAAPFSSVYKKKLIQKSLESLLPYGLGFETRLNDFVGHLSGGQRQIVALLCVLLGNTDMLLLDEFTSFMDEKSARLSLEILKRVLKKTNDISLLYVSHQDLDGLECDLQFAL